MQSKVLLTPVDSMVELIRETPNISILGISEKMRLPIQIVEVWILVLEEFEVVKVTYKGFEGYVALSKKELEQKKIVNKVDVENLKEIFIEKAKQKNYDYEKMRKL
ncbi:hypothetical protein EOM09_07520, partial [bacterium]|nr:hypothetical protein [bacterium]